jgi:fucose permease
LILTIIALGTFLYSLHTIFIAAAMDVAGDEVQSTVVSLIYGASFLGTLSPVFAGLIADKYGTEYTFLYGGAMILLAAFVLALTRLPKTANQLAQEQAG